MDEQTTKLTIPKSILIMWPRYDRPSTRGGQIMVSTRHDLTITMIMMKINF